jgi:enoyl-CoA hydratase
MSTPSVKTVGTNEATGAEPETLVRVEGRAGRITLNRPKALNALRYGQIAEIDAALTAWEHDDAVQVVILDGSGERAFCAGGDVRELYDAAQDGPAFAEQFWRDEYHLNARIHRYSKPVVALMDGIVMGGGIGLSAHASHRIVTERSQLAMPETTIGLVPDVGGTFLLARAPGHLGLYLGLLGARMGAADALYAGFADTHVASSELGGLVAELVDPNGDPVGVTIAEYASAPDPAVHALRQSDVDRLFASDTLSETVAALSADTATDWADKAVADLTARSPLALATAHRAIRAAVSYDRLEQALDQEFRIANHLYRNGEMLEGIRALIVDKDRAPNWTFPTIADVPTDAVERLLGPVDGMKELGLAGPTQPGA